MNREIRKTVWISALIILLITALMVAKRAGASDGLPDGIGIFYLEEEGLVCTYTESEWVIFPPDVRCYCPCLSDCEEYEPQTTLSPTDEPQPTVDPTETQEKPEPTKTEKPPKPTKTEKPPKEKKGNCGDGNGPEGSNPTTNCDEKKNDKQDEK